METKWKKCADMASSNARNLLLHADFLQEHGHREVVNPGANIKPTDFVLTIIENNLWDATKAAILKMERIGQIESNTSGKWSVRDKVM